MYICESVYGHDFLPEEIMNSIKQYDGVLRFVLVDKEDRAFEVERFCYLGSVDDWIYLDGSDDMESLVKEYVPHLGKDSFYELV